MNLVIYLGPNKSHALIKLKWLHKQHIVPLTLNLLRPENWPIYECTQNAKARKLVVTTHNQTNPHSFNLVRPGIVIKFRLEWSHWQTSPIKAFILKKAQRNKNIPSSPFLPTSAHKFGYNSAILGRTKNGLHHLVPHVIMYLVIHRFDIFQNGG